MLTRTGVAAVATAVVATMGGALPAPAAPTAGPPAAGQGKQATSYALEAFGYGSRVVGGSVPAGSDRSAFQVIGCTNKAGIDKANAESDVDLGDGIALSGVKTRVWTSRHGGTVTSRARHHIAKVTVGDLPAASLVLRDVSSTARVWHNANGFHATTAARVAKIVLRPVGGTALVIPAPRRGESVRLPGIGKLTLGGGHEEVGRGYAIATGDALRLAIRPTRTKVFLAHSRATIDAGVKQHLFGGSSFGTRLRGVEGALRSGETPFSVMPCEGTAGKPQTRSIARADLADTMSAAGLRTRQRAVSRGDEAHAVERASVARVSLGGGLVVKGVTARAAVDRQGADTSASARGTRVAAIRYQGERLRLSPRGTLRIPGVAKLATRVVQHHPGGIEVTALRVTLLDGSLATVDVGHAVARIRPSGL